jgi:SWIM zinc finger
MLHRPLQRKLAFANDDAKKRQGNRTLRLKSFRGDDWYAISLEDKTCDCEEYQAKAGRCEHLNALGIHRLKPFKPTSHNFLGIRRRKNEDILTFNRRDVNPVSQPISRDGLQGRIYPAN